MSDSVDFFKSKSRVPFLGVPDLIPQDTTDVLLQKLLQRYRDGINYSLRERAYTSIVASVYFNNTKFFCLSKKSLQNLISQDPNLVDKFNIYDENLYRSICSQVYHELGVWVPKMGTDGQATIYEVLPSSPCANFSEAIDYSVHYKIADSISLVTKNHETKEKNNTKKVKSPKVKLAIAPVSEIKISKAVNNIKQSHGSFVVAKPTDTEIDEMFSDIEV